MLHLNDITSQDPNRLFVIAGPCIVESKELLREVAGVMKPLCASLAVPYIFKASYRKANRTSGGSFEGIGDERALEYLAEIRAEFDVPVLTDIHSEREAELAARYVDVLQIPAFLSRQSDLLRAAAATGKVVNIKKGQFLAPEDIVKAVEKITTPQKPHPVWVTERGTTFGYHDLVVDMRSFVIMREQLKQYSRSQGGLDSDSQGDSYRVPIIYDATHSVQQPSVGAQSGGKREFIAPLARAAVAVGIDGLFFETHPNPAMAQSDAATQLPLAEAVHFLTSLVHLHHAVHSL
jgi:2-dehydro-3-deoxyphosphooctonate aldolase (KDO 8-P synthase)